MVHASEIRIGNIFLSDREKFKKPFIVDEILTMRKNFCEVISNYNERFRADFDPLSCTNDELYPIMLSDEWLEALYFKKSEDKESLWIHVDSGVKIHKADGFSRPYAISTFTDTHGNLITGYVIDYVHEMQNIIDSLTRPNDIYAVNLLLIREILKR